MTAEVDACFALLLRVTREMKRTGDESSDHLLHLDSLVGRLNLQVYSEERFIVCKFDGWPQVRERERERERVLPDNVSKTLYTHFTHIVKEHQRESTPQFAV